MDNRFQEFTLLIANIGRVINKIKNDEMSRFGLKGTQVNCLFYLSTNPNGMTATDICAISEEDKGAISRTLKELENEGYIISEKCENKKKYNSLLKMTDKGLEISKYINDKIGTILDYETDHISDEELKSFYVTFHKIYNNLKSVSSMKENNND